MISIGSPGVNPSNRGKVFPNLARHKMADGEYHQTDLDFASNTAGAELADAGIKVHMMPWPMPNSEVPSRAMGGQSGWSFRRAWYYWRAEGPGLPVEVAERLHATHGTVCRVAGHCGCPSPREWYKGFGVGSYHVDNQDGLNALAAALRSVYDPDKDPDAKPYMS